MRRGTSGLLPSALRLFAWETAYPQDELGRRKRLLIGFDLRLLPRSPLTRKGYAISVRRQSRQRPCSRSALVRRLRKAAEEITHEGESKGGGAAAPPLLCR